MTKPDNHDPRLIYLLATAHRRLEAGIERDTNGMSPARIGVLLALPVQGRLTMSTLAQALDLGAPAMTGLVDRMCKSGLLQRVQDPQDGRSSLVELTEAGRAARQQMAHQARMLNAQLREGFTDDEISTVARWLTMIRQRYAG